MQLNYLANLPYKTRIFDKEQKKPERTNKTKLPKNQKHSRDRRRRTKNDSTN